MRSLYFCLKKNYIFVMAKAPEAGKVAVCVTRSTVGKKNLQIS